MSKSFFPGTILISLALIGAGCDVTQYFKKVSTEPTTNNNQNTTLAEIEYYNTVIRQMNALSEQTSQIVDSYQNFQAATDQAERAKFTTGTNNTTAYDAAKKVLFADKPVMTNTDAQAKIEDKLTPYFVEYKTMLDAKVALGEYYERGRYKDDNEAQKNQLSKPLEESLDKVITRQNELFDLVASYQDKIELSIDENTQEPLELITLIQETLTKDIETLYAEYVVWIEAYNNDAKADVTAMQSAYDELMADTKKYQERAAILNVKSIDLAGTYFTAYMETVNKFSGKFENILRDEKTNALGDLQTLDGEVVDLYNQVIDAHNNLVGGLESS